MRKQTVQLHASVESHVVPSPDPRLLLLRRDHPSGRMLEVINVSEEPVRIPTAPLRTELGATARELLGGHDWSFEPESVAVPPYQVWWFVA